MQMLQTVEFPEPLARPVQAYPVVISRADGKDKRITGAAVPFDSLVAAPVP
ncbi:MAG: hypothetical protein HY006_04540 [Candidatus Sungbacteria bacterium]|nr:hypothetical protein [Candidatus Sungbacteria bacterium]